jgi:hypothetical protein
MTIVLKVFSDTSQSRQPLAVDGFVFSYLRLSAFYEDKISYASYSHYHIVAIYWPLKVKWDHILSNYAITFEHIVFVIDLFESMSKTLFKVLFSSVYLQICIFYNGISISCPTVLKLEVSLPQTEIRPKNVKTMRRLYRIYDSANAMQKRIRQVKGHLYARVWRYRSSLLANYYPIHAHASKTRYLEEFKINISSSRIQTKLSTRKPLNTKSILLYSLKCFRKWRKV